MTDPIVAARVKLGDALMDPHCTEEQVNAAQAELLAAIRGPAPTLITEREHRVCTIVRAEDGAWCALPDPGVHWPHRTHEGVQFPPSLPGFARRVL